MTFLSRRNRGENLNREGSLVDLTGESSNSLFEVLEDWEAQLKPHEALLPELEL